MTNADFRTALANLHMFHYATHGNEPTLDCHGHRDCPSCPFSNGTSCYIQDRDKLTSKQLAYLHNHHPEFFL